LVEQFAIPLSYTGCFSAGAITLLQFFAQNFIFIPMQHTAFLSPVGSSDLEADPIFNVVIAYEDFDTGKRAKETYDFLVSNLGQECRFANQMWKFDVLGIPKLGEMAAKDAVSADIISISCHATHDLSPEVKAWINSWVQCRSNAIALVGLFGETDAYNDTQNVRGYLAEVARRAGMEFFAQPNPRPIKQVEGLYEPERGAQRDVKTLSALAGVIQRDQSFPRWGINE
jgi:hypothetical protein